MTATRAQSLLAGSELTKAHDFLFEAHMLVTDVRSLFFNIGNFATAARLKALEARLDDELRTVDLLIAGSEPGILSAHLPPAHC